MLAEQGLPRQRSCMSRWFGSLSPGSLRSGTLVLTTTALGAGVLTLPFAVKELGWALGAAMVALLGMLNVASLEILLDAGIRHGVHSYHDLIAKLRGPVAAGFLDVTIIIGNVGGSAAYMIFIKQLLPSLLVMTFRIPAAAVNPELILVVVAVISFVASLPTQITALSKMCFLGVMSVLYIGTLLLCNALMIHVEDGIMELPAVNMQLSSEMSWAKITNGSSIIMLGFLCQFNVFFVCCDIKDPTAKRLQKITRRSTCFQIVCYIVIGLCGYISFGDFTHDNVLANFAPDDSVANLGRLLVCGSMLVQIPLSTFSTRATLVDILSRKLRNAADLDIRPHTLPAAASSVQSLHMAYSYSMDFASDDGIFISPAIPVSGTSGLKAPLLDVEGGTVAEEQLCRGSYVLHVVSTFLIILVSLALAILLPSVSALLGKLGGFCGVTQMYVLPCLILMQCQDLRPAWQRLGIVASFAAASLLGLASIIL